MPSRVNATATSKMRGDIVRGCAQSCCTARCPNRPRPSRSHGYVRPVLTTNQKGATAELPITSAAIRLGVGVFRAVADERYDLVLDIGTRLLRVQCKTAALIGDVLVVRCYSCRRTAAGMLNRSYTSEEIDAVAPTATSLTAAISFRSTGSMGSRQFSFDLLGRRTTKLGGSTGPRTSNSPLHLAPAGP
jgi:hypothetical protein